jgi:hypothetical protein
MAVNQDAQNQPAEVHGLAGAQVQYNDTTASVRNDFDATIREGEAGRESAVAFVEEAINKALAGILFVDVESIDSAKPVADFGLHRQSHRPSVAALVPRSSRSQR